MPFLVRRGIDPAGVRGFQFRIVGPAEPRPRAVAAHRVAQQRIEPFGRGGTGGEHAPAAFVHRLLRWAALHDGAPVEHLFIHIDPDFSKGIDRDGGDGVVDHLIGGMQERQFFAHVTGLFHHLLQLVDGLALAERVHSGLGRRGGAGGEEAHGRTPGFRVLAHGGEHYLLLVDGGEHGAAQQNVVGWRGEMVGTQDRNSAVNIQQPGADAVQFAQHRNEIGLRQFHPIDFSGAQRGGGGGRVRNDPPFHAIDVHLAPARGVGSGLLPRHIVFEAGEASVTAGDILARQEAERTAADDFRHLLIGISDGETFRLHDG